MCMLGENIMKSHEESGTSPLDITESILHGDVPHDSQDSSPRYVGGTISLSDDPVGLKSEDSTNSRVKFLCSYGGKICPRPHDNQLRYVMGETKVVVVNRSIAYGELMAKLTKLAGTSVMLKYQLPYEDLDALVSVVSDEDLQNMFEEYEKAESRNFVCRLRLFLFPIKWQEDAAEHIGRSRNSEHQFFDAVNGIPVKYSTKEREVHAHPNSEAPDYLFGLDSTSELPLINPSNSFRGRKAGELPIGDSSAKTGLQVPPSVPVPVLSLEHSIGQSYEIPLEQVSFCKSQFTRQLSLEKAQENSHRIASPSSPKSNFPCGDMLHGSDPDTYATAASETLPSFFSQRGVRDHRNSCSIPFAGINDTETLSKKHLMNSVAETSSLWIDHGHDFKLVSHFVDSQLPYTEELTPTCYNLLPNTQRQSVFPSGLGRTSRPPHECHNRITPEFQLKKSQETQQDNFPGSEVSQRGETDRALNGPNHWKPLSGFCLHNKEMNILKHAEGPALVQDAGHIAFEAQEEKGISSDQFQKAYISEESSDLLSRQAESGDRATALLQQHRQQLLHSSSPSAAGHETYRNGYQRLNRTDSFCGICLNCSTEFLVKGLPPPYHTAVAAPSVHHAPSQLRSLQTPVSGDVLCSRQVCSSLPPQMQYLKHIPTEATLNPQLPRASCLCNDQLASPRRACSPSRFKPNLPSRFYNENVQAKDKLAQIMVTKAVQDESIIYSPHVGEAHAELQFQRSIFANLPYDFSCNRDLIFQTKDVHEMMNAKANPIYHGVTS